MGRYAFTPTFDRLLEGLYVSGESGEYIAPLSDEDLQEIMDLEVLAKPLCHKVDGRYPDMVWVAGKDAFEDASFGGVRGRRPRAELVSEIETRAMNIVRKYRKRAL